MLTSRNTVDLHHFYTRSNLLNKAKIFFEKEQSTFYIAFAVIFIFIVARQWDRLVYPTLWAEDGALFFTRSFNEGIKSIFNPYSGYYQALPQIISLIIFKITIIYNPQLTLLICTFIYSYILSSLMKPSYTWINENKLVRFFLVLSITFVPGTTEIVGNLANLHSILFISVLIRLMAKFEQKYTCYDYIYFLLVSFSAGEVILAIPILLFRIHIARKNSFKNTIILSNLILLIIIISSIFLVLICFKNFSINDNHIYTIMKVLKYLPKFLLTSFNRFFYLPLLGRNITIYLNQFFASTIILGIFLSLGVLYGLIKFRGRYTGLIVLAVLCYMSETLLTTIVRPGAEIHPSLGRLLTQSSIDDRYMFYALPVILIFWSFFLRLCWRNYRFTNLVLILLSFYYCFLNTANFKFKNFYNLPKAEYADKYYWPFYSMDLNRIIKLNVASEITIPIAPQGWYFTIRSAPVKEV